MKNTIRIGNFLIILVCSLLIASCGKDEIPTPNASGQKSVSADSLKIRFWISNDAGTLHVRNIVINPARATFTTAAVVLNGDYLVYANSSETITIRDSVGLHVRSTVITISNLGNDTLMISAIGLVGIDTPNMPQAQIINATTFLIPVDSASQFRVIALPPWLTFPGNGPNNPQ